MSLIMTQIPFVKGSMDIPLRHGVQHLFELLSRQSTLRRPLIRVLLEAVALNDVAEFGLNSATVERYRREEV